MNLFSVRNVWIDGVMDVFVCWIVLVDVGCDLLTRIVLTVLDDCLIVTFGLNNVFIILKLLLLKRATDK